MLKRKKTVVALTAAAMGLGLLGSVPASAAATSEAPANMKSWDTRGVVIARGGILIRSGPSTSSSRMGWIDRSEIVWITCKTAGQDVWGNGIWYKLGSHNGYIAARYVKNVDSIPWC